MMLRACIRFTPDVSLRVEKVRDSVSGLELEPHDIMEIINLRKRHDRELLHALYEGLFLPNFPIPEQQEDPSVWEPLLWDSAAQPKPLLDVLVAGQGFDSPGTRQLWGFIISEYFRGSSCGLLTYLAVHPLYRCRGVAHSLMDAAMQALEDHAAERETNLKAVFGEVNDPDKVRGLEDAQEALKRVHILSKLGAKRVPVEYVQPQLRPGQGRSRSLSLVVFPIRRNSLNSLSVQTLVEFLDEFYRALGVKDPKSDPDLLRVVSSVRATASLRLEALPEGS